jgi:hypothetical protein
MVEILSLHPLIDGAIARMPERISTDGFPGPKSGPVEASRDSPPVPFMARPTKNK